MLTKQIHICTGLFWLFASAAMLVPGCNIWLALGCQNDAWVCVVEAVLCQPHEGCILLHQQNEQRIALYAVHLPGFTMQVRQWRFCNTLTEATPERTFCFCLWSKANQTCKQNMNRVTALHTLSWLASKQHSGADFGIVSASIPYEQGHKSLRGFGKC